MAPYDGTTPQAITSYQASTPDERTKNQPLNGYEKAVPDEQAKPQPLTGYEEARRDGSPPAEDDSFLRGQHTQPRRLMASWYTEIASLLVLGVGSLIGMAYILFYMQNEPLDKWPYEFPSFSAMIAILASIAEFSLVFVASRCISQLKWQFIRVPRPVQTINDYDAAARGPMGSLLLLSKFLFSKALVRPETLGALIMIVSVAINTASQQIFSLYDVNVMRDNGTATFGVSTSYNTNPPPSGAGLTNAPFRDVSLTGAFVASIYNKSIEPSFSCQSGRCEWPGEYYTAGFAAACEDVTASTIRNGTYSYNNQTSEHQYNMTTPGGLDLNLGNVHTMRQPVVKISAVNLSTYGFDTNSASDMMRIAEYRLRGSYEDSYLNGFYNATVTPDTEWNTVTECTLSFAVHKLSNVSAEGSEITIGSREVIPIPTDLDPWFPGASGPSSSREMVWNASADGSRPQIRFHLYDLFALQSGLYTGLDGLLAEIGDEANGRDSSHDNFGLSSVLGRWNITGISEWLPKAALAITNTIMSSSDQETYQVITGQSNVVIVHVRIEWGWSAVLMFEVFATIVLLLLTLLRSQMERGVPQWKESSTALLFHAVDEDTDHKSMALRLRLRGEKEVEDAGKMWMIHVPSQK